jgi:glyoxylase-like metal-dependent hydrolase (beta-lactamase superfamily II)
LIENNLFCGDTLFEGSIGRTDLPGGDCNKLIESINNKLLILDDSTIVYPGHGPFTTIGREKEQNPFLYDAF